MVARLLVTLVRLPATFHVVALLAVTGVLTVHVVARDEVTLAATFHVVALLPVAAARVCHVVALLDVVEDATVHVAVVHTVVGPGSSYSLMMATAGLPVTVTSVSAVQYSVRVEDRVR